VNDIITVIMESEIPKGHFASQVGEVTLSMLMAYREFGVLSRSFMLEKHGKVLEEILSRSGDFSEYSENELAFAEGRIYVELVERVCQLIEDFSTLCYALWNDLSDFPANILRQDRPSTKKLLEELTGSERWFILLRYPDLDKLQFSAEDKEFLGQHYERNIHVLQNFAKKLEGTRKLHWRFYTKHKHANPVVYGFKKIEVGGEPTIIIPAFDDQEQPKILKGIMMNHSWYKKQRIIANTVINLIKDLLDGTFFFIEINGKPIIERVSYYEMDKAASKRLRHLTKEYNKNLIRNPIEVTLKADVPDEFQRRFVQFYDNLDIGDFDT